MLQMRLTTKRALMALVMLASLAPGSAAVPMDGGTSTTEGLKFGGDIRIRQESFFNKTAGQADRHRQRMRLRFGVEAKMSNWEVGMGLASGTGEQTSTNQTFTNGWNQKNIYIDKAFASYKPWAWLKMTGGKQNNPFWRLYSSDIVWDGDLNPEGFSQQTSFDLADSISVFGNFFQGPVNEINSGATDKDPWLFGNQIGMKSKLGGGVRWDLGLANYTVSHEAVNPLHATSTFDSTVIQGDNTRVTGQGALLAGQFNILHLTSQFGFQAGLPVRVQGDMVKNVHKARANGQNSGYQAGFIVNSAKTKGTWEAAYFWKYSEANATLSDFADSDWGAGGTNRKGHIIWLAYCPTDFLTLQGKYFMTERVNPFIGASAPYTATTTLTRRDINRFQLDAVIKF